jgi:hypothetical protein
MRRKPALQLGQMASPFIMASISTFRDGGTKVQAWYFIRTALTSTKFVLGDLPCRTLNLSKTQSGGEAVVSLLIAPSAAADVAYCCKRAEQWGYPTQ